MALDQLGNQFADGGPSTLILRPPERYGAEKAPSIPWNVNRGGDGLTRLSGFRFLLDQVHLRFHRGI